MQHVSGVERPKVCQSASITYKATNIRVPCRNSSIRNRQDYRDRRFFSPARSGELILRDLSDGHTASCQNVIEISVVDGWMD